MDSEGTLGQAVSGQLLCATQEFGIGEELASADRDFGQRQLEIIPQIQSNIYLPIELFFPLLYYLEIPFAKRPEESLLSTETMSESWRKSRQWDAPVIEAMSTVRSGGCDRRPWQRAVVGRREAIC